MKKQLVFKTISFLSVFALSTAFAATKSKVSTSEEKIDAKKMLGIGESEMNREGKGYLLTYCWCRS